MTDAERLALRAVVARATTLLVAPPHRVPVARVALYLALLRLQRALTPDPGGGSAARAGTSTDVAPSRGGPAATIDADAAPANDDDGGDGALEDDDEEGLVVLLRAAAPLAAKLDLDGFALGDVAALDDGTALVPTVYTPLARDLVALRLAEDYAALAAEPVDPRGVPACTTSDLEALAEARTYDDALRALGDRVVFLDLGAARALPDAEKARLRSLGEEG